MSENHVRVVMSRRLRDEHGAPVRGLRVISEPALEVPRDLLTAGIEGSAELALSVASEGSVARARVVTTTHETFGAAVKESAIRWKFRPLSESDIEAPAEIRCHFTFETN